MMKKILFISFLLLVFCAINAQPTNTYSPVIELNTCLNFIQVEDGTNFNTGDTVLLIQMKGADIDTSNTPSFGTIKAYNGSGNYEFNIIKSKTGNYIEFKNRITRKYDVPDGKVQLIGVRIYQSLDINAPLTCPPWDGSKGGVIVLYARDSITLNDNIDVSGKGFAGGFSLANLVCPNCNNASNYAYPLADDVTGEKGEGIFTILNQGFEGGRGAIANGGGSGSCKNGGGGGGSNTGHGGIGGLSFNICSGSSTNASGIGGYKIDSSLLLNKVFFGGGGGAGESDNTPAVGTNGTTGGGIVIIRCNKLIGNGRSIIADGLDQNQIAQEDGGGGGGAGGSILLDVNTYSGNTNIFSKGGKGSDNNSNNTAGYCHAPGGGGGGGMVWFKQSVTPAGVTVSTTGGSAGFILNSTAACAGTSYGAQSGTNGGSFHNLSLIDTNTPFQVNIQSVSQNDTVLSCGSYIFKGQSTTIASPIASWEWDFGDGSPTVVSQNIAHSYSSPATHLAKLIVTDGNGCKDSSSKFVMGLLKIADVPQGGICFGKNQVLTTNVVITNDIVTPGSEYEYSFQAIPGWTTSIGNWTLGNAPFGNVTNGNPPEFNYNTYWPSGVPAGADGYDLRLRKVVDLTGHSLSGIGWKIGVDNGFEMFVNGTHIYTAYDPTNYAWRWEYSGVIPASFLNPGNNIIALGLVDNGGSTTFDMTLYYLSNVPPYSLLWSTGQTNASITVSPTQTTKYFATLTSGNLDCTDSVLVNVKPLSSSTINKIICDGQSYSGHTTSGTYTDTFTSSNGCDSLQIITLTVKPKATSTITQSICQGQNYYGYTASGTYTDTYTSVNGCDSIRVLKLLVLPAIPRPDLGADTKLCTGDTIILYPGSFNTYLWQDGSSQPRFTVTQAALYSVNVSNGCGSAIDEIFITGNSCDIIFPSAFTPNGDGTNDVFRALNGVNIQSYKLNIYNRLGQKVFSTNDYYKGWDGKYKGQALDSNVFVWYCEFVKPRTSELKKIKGVVMLVR